MESEYLKRILNARVYDVAIESPLEQAPILSERISNEILVKREDLQPVFSFKIRGAYNKMANLSADDRAKGVIASSAGNHAQGVALAAKMLGCSATIVMPVTTPAVKIDAVKALGADVTLHGESYAEANDLAQELRAETGRTFVHPFDDPDVIAGQGTIGMEILRQHTGPLDVVFVAIGGGGLIAGIATYIKALRPEVRIVGVQAADSDAMAQSIEAGERVVLDEVGLFSDGTAVRQVGEETFRLASQYVDEIVRVDTDQICAAIKDVFTDTRSILEPAGALAVAGAKEYAERTGVTGQTFVAVLCGANMNFDRLRFVAERAEIGEQREAVFVITIPERPGSFLSLCELIGDRNVTEFNYRMGDPTRAQVFVGVQVDGSREADGMAEAFTDAGFETLNLTNDEVAKVHLRHLVGGRSGLATEELLYRFEFPERPGALTRFLGAMNPSWSISLFHYRNHGADYGRVLIGMKVPVEERDQLESFFSSVGYRHWDESGHPAYQLLLG